MAFQSGQKLMITINSVLMLNNTTSVDWKLAMQK